MESPLKVNVFTASVTLNLGLKNHSFGFLNVKYQMPSTTVFCEFIKQFSQTDTRFPNKDKVICLQ